MSELHYQSNITEKPSLINTYIFEPIQPGGVRTVWEHLGEQASRWLSVAGLTAIKEDQIYKKEFPTIQYPVQNWNGRKEDFDETNWTQAIAGVLNSACTERGSAIIQHFPIGSESFGQYPNTACWMHANEFFSCSKDTERNINLARVLAELKTIANSKALIVNTEIERQQIARDYSQEGFQSGLEKIVLQANFNFQNLTLLSQQEILDKTVVVPLGVENSKFSTEIKEKLPSKSEILESECPDFYEQNKEIFESPNLQVFGNWGRISPQKGLEDTIQTFAQIVKNNSYLAGGKDPVLMLIGPFNSDDKYFQKLQELIDTEGLQGRVFFPGSIVGSLAQKIIDVGLITPKYETFGLSAGEIITSGTPSFFMGEQVLQEVYPTIKSANNPKDLADLIVDTISNTEEVDIYTNESREYVVQNYTWENTFQKLVEQLELKGFDLKSKLFGLPQHSNVDKPETFRNYFTLEDVLKEAEQLSEGQLLAKNIVTSDFDGTARDKSDSEGIFSSFSVTSVPAFDRYFQRTKDIPAIATARTAPEVIDLLTRTNYNSDGIAYNYMGISIAENGSALVAPNIPKITEKLDQLQSSYQLDNNSNYVIIDIAETGIRDRLNSILENSADEAEIENEFWVSSTQAQSNVAKLNQLQNLSGHQDMIATQNSINRRGTVYLQIDKKSQKSQEFVQAIQKKSQDSGVNCFVDEKDSVTTVELASKSTNKGTGLKYLQEIYKNLGIEVTSISHIGDSENDTEAFDYALANSGQAFYVGLEANSKHLPPNSTQTSQSGPLGLKEALERLRALKEQKQISIEQYSNKNLRATNQNIE